MKSICLNQTLTDVEPAAKNRDFAMPVSPWGAIRESRMGTRLGEEAALLTKAREGDTEAFAVLINQYDRRVYRVALHITRNPEDAEDALQEALIKAYKGLGEFRGDSRFYTWLVRITINEALGRLRKRGREREVSFDEPAANGGDNLMPREIESWDKNPEQRYARTELQAILDQAMEELAPPLRIVFLLRDVEEFSGEQTAGMLGLSLSRVKSRLLRARLKLRERLTKYFRRG